MEKIFCKVTGDLFEQLLRFPDGCRITDIYKDPKNPDQYIVNVTGFDLGDLEANKDHQILITYKKLERMNFDFKIDKVKVVK